MFSSARVTGGLRALFSGSGQKKDKDVRTSSPPVQNYHPLLPDPPFLGVLTLRAPTIADILYFCVCNAQTEAIFYNMQEILSKVQQILEVNKEIDQCCVHFIKATNCGKTD